MTGNIRGYTPNYGFKLINFDTPRWHTLEYDNWQTVDGMFLQLGTPPVRGVWMNSTKYLIGERVFDPDTLLLYRCLEEHTSITIGTFEADRTAHPNYWSLQQMGVPVYRGVWTPVTLYAIGDLVYVEGELAHYICTKAHTSSATFEPDVANWQLAFDPSEALQAAQEAQEAAELAQEASEVAAGESNSSASNAANSANAASYSESNSATSAENSANSATDSANSAIDSATSAGESASSASDAAASALEAANLADALRGTSTTSNTIALGLMTFETQAGKNFDPGSYITIVDTNLPTLNVIGAQIVSYTDTTLEVNVNYIKGSGTIADWQLYVSGAAGEKGDMGLPGPAGAGSGDMLQEANLSDVDDPAAARTNLGLGVTDKPTFAQITLAADPLLDLEVATKKYVDDNDSGGIVGPASSVDNTVPRFDSTTGQLLQGSPLILEDNGKFVVMSGANKVVEYGTTAPLSTTGGLRITAMPPHGQQFYIVPRSDIDGATHISGNITVDGPLTLPATPPTDAKHAATKGYVDSKAAASGVTVSDEPPATPTDNMLWWDSDRGNMYIYYNDGVDPPQWVQVIATPAVDFSLLVQKTGDTMIGHLGLPANPGPTQAVRRDYIDTVVPVAASIAEYRANSAPAKTVTSGVVWGAAGIVAVADAATLAIDMSLGLDFSVPVTAAGRTLAAPINVKQGQKGVIYIMGLGGSITTWATAWKFPGGNKPTLTTSGIDVISYYAYDSNNIICAFLQDCK